MLGAGVVLRGPDGRRRPLVPMRELAAGTDRYGAEVTVTSEGLWHFEVEAWGDPHRPLAARRGHQGAARPGRRADAGRRRAALRAGRRRRFSGPALVRGPPNRRDAAARAGVLADLAVLLRDPSMPAPGPPGRGRRRRHHRDLDAFPLRDLLTRSARYPVIVHRERALYGSWYEFFPRSEGAVVDAGPGRAPKSGTLRTAARRLDAIAADGLRRRLPPAGPPDRDHRPEGPEQLAERRGRATPARRGRSARPRAATTPSTPTWARWPTSTPSSRRAAELGLEVALDLALQTSPDHPWVTEHPEWFTTGRRHDRVRGEPAEEVPGHLPAQLRQRSRGHLRRGAADRPALDGPRDQDLPGGQPAHQAAAVLGAAAGRDRPHRPGRDLPGRGLHPARP